MSIRRFLSEGQHAGGDGDVARRGAALRVLIDTMNPGFAFIYNVLGIPLAAGVLFRGWLLSPMIAALAMSSSSESVAMNALRLR